MNNIIELINLFFDGLNSGAAMVDHRKNATVNYHVGLRFTNKNHINPINNNLFSWKLKINKLNKLNNWCGFPEPEFTCVWSQPQAKSHVLVHCINTRFLHLYPAKTIRNDIHTILMVNFVPKFSVQNVHRDFRFFFLHENVCVCVCKLSHSFSCSLLFIHDA